MTRRKLHKREEISLHDIINESLNEIFNNKIETDFKEIDYGEYVAYSFKLNSGNEYDLEFHYSSEPSNILLNNDKTLGEMFNRSNNEQIECFDIAFTLTNIINKENPYEFERETNYSEHIELFGRMAYILSKIINNQNRIKLFVIGGDAKRNKLKIYKELFQNHFKNYFDLFYGESQYHTGDSLFLIRK